MTPINNVDSRRFHNRGGGGGGVGRREKKQKKTRQLMSGNISPASSFADSGRQFHKVGIGGNAAEALVHE